MESEMGGADPDPQAQALVQSIGEKVVAASDAHGTPYRFNSTCWRTQTPLMPSLFPGGPVFITRGLLNRLENEAQLGGVLGHEVGHVVARHAAEHIAKSQLGQSIVGAVGVASSDNYGRGQQAAMIAAVVAQMAQLRYGRNDELEADKLGVRFMSQSGYDPRAMLEVMRILEASSKSGRQPEFMSTHPNPGNREQHIKEQIQAEYPNGVPSGLKMGAPLGRP